MKVFIVFLGVLIINISFLCYQGDLGRYLRTQAAMKALAEECGAGAALFYDAEAYGDGSMVANREEALKYTDYVLHNADPGNGKDTLADIDSAICFFDDTLTARRYIDGKLVSESGFSYPYRYEDEGGKEIIIDSPSVIVTLSIMPNEIFRLPFIGQDAIVRSAMYEIKADGQ